MEAQGGPAFLHDALCQEDPNSCEAFPPVLTSQTAMESATMVGIKLSQNVGFLEGFESEDGGGEPPHVFFANHAR